MSFDWQGYKPFNAASAAPAGALPPAEARRAFERSMATKHKRIAMLGQLLGANGTELGTSDESIQHLNDWFIACVEADPAHPGSLLPIWYSVVHDVGMFLGDVMIERHPNLRWAFSTWGKKSINYQELVLMGFGSEDPKFHTNLNIHEAAIAYGHRIIASRGSIPTYGVVEVRGTPIDVDAIAAVHREREIENDEFVRWMQVAARRNGEIVGIARASER
jgi:hypothetical protein